MRAENKAKNPASILEGPRLHTLIYILVFIQEAIFKCTMRNKQSLYDVLYVKQTGM